MNDFPIDLALFRSAIKASFFFKNYCKEIKDVHRKTAANAFTEHDRIKIALALNKMFEDITPFSEKEHP